MTGPQSGNTHFYAQEYSKALGRTISYQDIPVEPWRAGLLERGLPVNLVKHLAKDGRPAPGVALRPNVGRRAHAEEQLPLHAQDLVRKHAAVFTAPAKQA